MFTFCPLQGALSESTASQSLQELDGGVKVLVGVGWDESFNVDTLAELEKQVPTLSLVLLTHATVSHLAAYVHCCKNFPLFTRVPAYATRPVIDLGRSLTQDLYASSPAACTAIPQSSLSELAYAYAQTASTAKDLLLQPPSPDDIARYFSLIQPLKYSQPHQPLPSPFSPPLNGLTITAYNSGHTLGGTIWHIQHGLESIVYAVDWNQARENVFAGAAWLDGAAAAGAEVVEQLRKPTALVCSSRGAQPGGRVKRDEMLVETIRARVSKGATVLIPVDSGARVLEMAYLLEHAWRQDASSQTGGSLKSAKLFLVGRNMSSTMRHARSMLEWMDGNIVREFEACAEGQRKANGASNDRKEAGPFDFKYLRLVERKAQVAKLLAGAGSQSGDSHGRVILASDTSMEWGFSKDLIKGLASDPRNLLILTDRPGAAITESGNESVARSLWQWYQERRDGVSVEQTAAGHSLETVHGGGRELRLRYASRQALEGEELAIYQQWLATQRQLQATQNTGGATALEATADVDDASSDSSSDSDDDEDGGQQQGKALTVSATMQAGRKNVVLKDEDLGINILIKKKGVYDFDTRGKKGRERCFPLVIRRRRQDDFGEMIRPEDYLRAEEKDEENAEGGHVAAEDDKLGKKRKWADVAKKASGPRRRGHGDRAQAAADEDVDGAAAASASDALEPDELDAVEDTEPEEPTGPCKLVYTLHPVNVHMGIAYVDFSGLHDRRSLDMLIPLIQPRKLILVGGSRDETMALAADCRAALSKNGGDKAVDVFTPEMGAWVDASVDTNAWVVKLADPLVKKLKWQNVRGFSIVTISGQLLAAAGAGSSSASSSSPGVGDGADVGGDGDEDESRAKRRKMEPGIGAVTTTTTTTTISTTTTPLASSAVPLSLPVLDVVPANLLTPARTAAQPLHVGDLRLADLRRAMQAAGHGAEFRGEGMLVIDGSVVVRKTTEGRVEVESVAVPMGGENGSGGSGRVGTGGGKRNTVYAVKRAIYDGLAVVTGA